MRRFFGLFLAVAGLCANAPALDNEAWVAIARQAVAEGTLVTSGDTPEDGLYCLAAAPIAGNAQTSAEARIAQAELDAKRRLAASLEGEAFSASREWSAQTTTVTTGDETERARIASLKTRHRAKVEALLRGIRTLGQISVGGRDYILCLATEEMADQAIILREAQAQLGDAGVVVAVGEAADRETALQKALRGAVEQVLGTLVVGYDKASSEGGFRRKLFSGTDGMVERYRVTAEREVVRGVRVEVVAKVSRVALLEDYANYMKFLGDPAFYIEASTPDLAAHFSDFFTAMGLKIAADPYQSHFTIYCSGAFHTVRHPADGRPGTQLSLRFRVQENASGEVLIDMMNNPRKAASFLPSAERRAEACAERAFAQMKQPLHERIQAMVAKLVSRQMDAAQAEE